MRKKLRDYQKLAIKKAKKHFAAHDRGKVIWPCGLGKTFLSIAIAQAMGAEKIVICVPSLALVQQTLREWAAEYAGKDVDWLCVCSDSTVKDHTDQWMVDPAQLGIAVTTSSAEIGKFLRKRTGNMKVVFCTYHSGARLATGAKGFTFDLGVFDEAHKTAGVQGSAFSKLLSDSSIKIRKRLFMTATERFYRGQRDDVVSMADEDIYGGVIDSISFKAALDTEQLCDYQVVVISVTQSEVSKAIAENKGVMPGKKWRAVEAGQMAAMLAVREVVKTRKIKRLISFHNTVARAQSFQKLNEDFSKNTRGLKIESLHVNGAQPPAIREGNMDAFKTSSRAMITNCQCLTEGVDIPDVDAVVFADPKNSTVDVVQAVGRAIRRSNGKKTAYVIIPVIVGDNGSTQDDQYDSAINTIRQLGSVDDRIVAYFDPKGGKPLGTGIIEFEKLVGSKIELQKFTSSIQVRYWDRVKHLVPFLPFEEAREFVRGLGLKGKNEWREYSKSGRRPSNVPSNPSVTYGGQFISWGDFLGYKHIRHGVFLPFESARLFVRSLKLDGCNGWREYCKSGSRPSNIPSTPERVYADQFISWPDFIGYEQRIGIDFLPFEEAREYVRGLGIGNWREWFEYSKSGSRPKNIPSVPHVTYKSQFISMPDFLGYAPKRKAPKK